MRRIDDLNQLEKPLHNPVLTIGNFDGVHKGHLVLFEKVKERARAIGGESAVMTFEPHPIRVMKPGNDPLLITPTSQKLDLIARAGIEVIFCLPFTREFAAISAEAFVKNILVEKIGVKEIVVGYDYTFGRNREGNTRMLMDMGEKFGFAVHHIGPVHIDHTLVSSTSIRKLVEEGQLSEAKKLLGRDYQIQGTVVRGQNRGGTLLRCPTANLQVVDELLPKKGVYAVTVLIDGKTYEGVTNIGHNPTFGTSALSLETHILDFHGDLLGKTIKVNFLQRLRDEKTFDSIGALSDQIAQDVEQARVLLRGRETT
jgi:riboflavin kinase/FMN adenylyltransferase